MCIRDRSYRVHIFTDSYLVLSQYTHLTDGQTDVDRKTSQSHGKKCELKRNLLGGGNYRMRTPNFAVVAVFVVVVEMYWMTVRNTVYMHIKQSSALMLNG